MNRNEQLKYNIVKQFVIDNGRVPNELEVAKLSPVDQYSPTLIPYTPLTSAKNDATLTKKTLNGLVSEQKQIKELLTDSYINLYLQHQAYLYTKTTQNRKLSGMLSHAESFMAFKNADSTEDTASVVFPIGIPDINYVNSFNVSKSDGIRMLSKSMSPVMATTSITALNMESLSASIIPEFTEFPYKAIMNRADRDVLGLEVILDYPKTEKSLSAIHYKGSDCYIDITVNDDSDPIIYEMHVQTSQVIYINAKDVDKLTIVLYRADTTLDITVDQLVTYSNTFPASSTCYFKPIYLDHPGYFYLITDKIQPEDTSVELTAAFSETKDVDVTTLEYKDTLTGFIPKQFTPNVEYTNTAPGGGIIKVANISKIDDQDTSVPVTTLNVDDFIIRSGFGKIKQSSYTDADSNKRITLETYIITEDRTVLELRGTSNIISIEVTNTKNNIFYASFDPQEGYMWAGDKLTIEAGVHFISMSYINNYDVDALADFQTVISDSLTSVSYEVYTNPVALTWVPHTVMSLDESQNVFTIDYSTSKQADVYVKSPGDFTAYYDWETGVRLDASGIAGTELWDTFYKVENSQEGLDGYTGTFLILKAEFKSTDGTSTSVINNITGILK